MFRALLAYPQEAFSQTEIRILRACYVSWLHQGFTPTLVQPTDITRI
jgi:hypothetical protein